MAVRGWGGSIATAIGVAAGAGAAQLGLGYGLGVVAWLPAVDRTSEATWMASLAWAVWIAATSTVVGAICAARLSVGVPRNSTVDDGAGTRPGVALRRGGLAVAAAAGGLVTVALVAVPARAATRADTLSPQTIAAGYAVSGVLIGLLAAIWALSSPAVGNNVLATTCWLWLLATVTVVDGVLSGRGSTGAQLGVWQITENSDRFWFRDYFYWPGVALSLGSALLIGALAARSTARRVDARVGAVVSGGVGPLVVAAAYFLATPRLVGIRAEQVSAHLMAPYAVIAGLTGSVLVVALAQRAEQRTRWAGTDTVADRPEPQPRERSMSIPSQPTRATGADGAAGGQDAPDGHDVPVDSRPTSEPMDATRDQSEATGKRSGVTGKRSASRSRGRTAVTTPEAAEPDETEAGSGVNGNDVADEPPSRTGRTGRATRRAR